MHDPLRVVLVKVFSNLLSLRVEISKLSQGQLAVVANAVRYLEHTHSTAALDAGSTPMVSFEVCHEISEPPSAACA